MTESKDHRGDAFRPEEMDLSKLTMEQLRELKDAIVARASDRVGPEGFNPIMQGTDDFSGWASFTGDPFTDPRSWWINVAQFVYTLINVASRRVGLAIAFSGAALAASHLYTTDAGSRYGGAMLGAAALFGVLMLIDMARMLNWTRR